MCEKSDGQRVLLLIVFNKQQGVQEVYLIDRKNHYRLQHMSLFFPHDEIPIKQETLRRLDMVQLGEYGVRKDTLLDGELVLDTGADGVQRLRLLLFDCIVLDGQRMTGRPLSKRYARLSQLLYPPFSYFMRKTPEAARDAPFEIKVKKMDLAYGIRSVLQFRIPSLEHGNDGLIFTCINSGYVNGTDPKIIKWKPPSENTIDFKLRLRFPPDLQVDPRGNIPDLKAKPFFQLDEFLGKESKSYDDGYRYFDWLYVEDEEWERYVEHCGNGISHIPCSRMKESGEQFDDRIVECYWNAQGGPPMEENGQTYRAPAWRLHRIRDDKHDGNHTSVVQKILQSIQDGVEEDQLVAQEDDIRAAWKSAQRSQQRSGMDTAASNGAVAEEKPSVLHRGPSAPMRGTPPDWLRRL